MQQKIQQFVFLCERILSEPGDLRTRRSWNELHSVALELAPYMKPLSQNFDAKYSLLFLLSCDNEGTVKSGCMSMLFRKILSKIPSRDLLNVLSIVNRLELNNYLLPFLYENDLIGSVATYVAAILGLKVKYDAFEFFLTSRDWNKEDLINLSFLVLEDEKELLKQSLNDAFATSQKDALYEFINVLAASKAVEPIMPNLKEAETAKVEEKPQPKVSLNASNAVNTANASNAQKTTVPNGLNEAVDQAQKSVAPKTVPVINKSVNKVESFTKAVKSRTAEMKAIQKKSENAVNNILNSVKDKISVNSNSDFVENIKGKLPLIASVLGVILVAYFLMASFVFKEPEETAVKMPPKEGKIPSYWVNAVTNQKLTPQYIQADVDYRMGELYLTRGLYNEALRFFEDALRTEPKHLLAKLRMAYVELLQQNYFASKKLLKEVLAVDSKMQNANLYMARNYAWEKDIKNAGVYYKKEYKLYNQLDVGMEYANYLAYMGNHNEAMEVVAKLQEKYPDKMLILESYK